ncbi:class I adenylate-forming enzyme family protein [Actinomadura scrupuli]|uniref:class I adenylate-forming enzyme family protein n=1 Tax=Actinomadura scrupuli TaxID=559629 RepID=UPI003D99F0D3
MSLWSLVEWRAARTPDAEMLVDEHGRRVTFREFREHAGRVAAGLAGRGVAAGTPVTWQLPTTVEALVLTAALARLGAVQNPVMPVYGARDLAFVVRQTGARLLVVAPEWNGRDLGTPARELAAGMPGLDLLVAGGDLPESRPEPPTSEPPASEPPRSEPASGPADDPVRWIFYTSGTTAEPKGARHTDGSVLASSRGMGERLACTPADRVGMVFPVAHIGGCGTWLGACLMYGCTLILDAVFDPDRTTELQRREGVTLAGSGTVFTQIYLAAQRRRPHERLFPRVRALTSGAAPKPATLHGEVKRELGGVGVLSGYGMTEAPILTMSAPGDPDEALARTEGRATEGVHLRVVGPGGRELGPGEEGELRARGPQVMRGYVDAALDADAFDAEGYLRTGDLGTLDEHGNVTITGRLKDVIIRKGETISARAVEEEVLAHPGVADVAVIGLAEPVRGELACAVIVPSGKDPPPTLAQLTGFLRRRDVPVRRWPERLEVLDALPRNATGKVLKAELRRRYSGERPSP